MRDACNVRVGFYSAASILDIRIRAPLS